MTGNHPNNSHSRTPGSAAGTQARKRREPKREALYSLEMNRACDEFFKRTGTYSGLDVGGRLR